jgi:tetratricopeptide (TPR) repeat protein
MNPGDSISRYLIVKELGKGGMGVVYEAADTRLKRPVALKFLPGDTLTDQEKQRFRNEALAAASVQHPNICPIYDIEEADGKLFIAMALLDGETLLRRLARGPLSGAEALAIAVQMADGLAEAHARKVVHRDVKSGNVMLDASGHACIMDFGLALRDGHERLTVAGNAIGTPGYMSPEQAAGGVVDYPSDIWSLGVVLYEMLTGTLPFRGGHNTAIFGAIAHNPHQWPAEPGVDAALRRIVDKALEKRPEDRWESAQAMAKALRVAGGLFSQADVAPQSTVTVAVDAKRERRGRRRWAVGALALAVVATGCLLLWLGGRFGRLPDSDQERQVAVIPFRVIGNAESARVVTDGLVDVVTAALADPERFHGRITAVPSSEILARDIHSAEDARRVYNVELAITGSVHPVGRDRLEFLVALVDAAKLRQITTTKFEYDPANALASRDAAVEHVARLLNFEVTPAVREAVGAGDSRVPAAYAAYLEGVGLVARYDVGGNLERSIAAFQRAISLDPGYALAHASLAGAYWHQMRTSGKSSVADLALSNARRAVALAPDLSQPHTVLGQVYGTMGLEHEGVEQLKEALRIAPGDPDALRGLARALTNLGRFGEAEDLYRKAIQSRPGDWYAYWMLGNFLKQQERYSEAEPALRKAKELSPSIDMTRRALGMLYTAQGRYREAIDQLQESLRLHPNAVNMQVLGTAYFYQHRYADAVEVLERAAKLDPEKPDILGNLAICYRWNGVPGDRYIPLLSRAAQLTEQLLETVPTDYSARANLAEYEARLGNRKGALVDLERIPESARRGLASRLVITYELTGKRPLAVALIKSHLQNPATLNQIKDDPDLAGLWADPSFQRLLLETAPTK